MKLPKEGRITIEIGSDGAVYSVTKRDIWSEKYESDFPAYEIPPHGKLKDADALINTINQSVIEQERVFNSIKDPMEKLSIRIDMMHDKRIVRILENAPTIIEAEEEKE